MWTARLSLDWTRVLPLRLNASDVATLAQLAPVVEARGRRARPSPSTISMMSRRGRRTITSASRSPYVFDGAVRKYRPDFLIRLTTGARLVLEVKGQDSPQNDAKRAALDEWTRAVTEHGGFGYRGHPSSGGEVTGVRRCAERADDRLDSAAGAGVKRTP
jgi:hypothetical protein